MKIVLGVLIALVALGIAGYFGFPFLLEKETRGLQTEIQAIKERLEKTETYIKREEKAAQEAEVKDDAGLPQVIKTLNKLSAQVGSLENDLKTGLTWHEDLIKKQGTLMGESIKKQNDSLEKADKEHQEKLQKIFFQIAIGQAKDAILKFKGNILDKNFGLAKNDLEALSEVIKKKRPLQTPEQKKSWEELQVLIKKVKAEMDSDVPAALNRMDLLWHEMDNLVEK